MVRGSFYNVGVGSKKVSIVVIFDLIFKGHIEFQQQEKKERIF